MAGYDTSWTFRKPQHFWKFLNKQMDLENLNGNGKYKLVFFKSMSGDDFNDMIDSNGCLKSDITNHLVNTTYYNQVVFDLKRTYIDNGENGFSLRMDTSSVTDITISTPFYLQAVALVKVSGDVTGSNYVVAYSRLSTKQYCEDTISLLAESEFVGHSSCRELSR